MKVTATADDLRAIAEVFKFAAILDDRVGQPDKARIAAWAEQIHRHKLERNDLLDGLQAFYDSPSERAIQVGDVIQHAKAARRKRREQQREAELKAIEEAGNSKAADDTRAFAAGITFGKVPRTKRLEAAETALQCPTNADEAKAAIREFLSAKAEAKRTQRGVSMHARDLAARQRAAAPPQRMEDQ